MAKKHDYFPACYLHLKPKGTENIGTESFVGSNELNAAANFRIKVNLSPNIAVHKKDYKKRHASELKQFISCKEVMKTGSSDHVWTKISAICCTRVIIFNVCFFTQSTLKLAFDHVFLSSYYLVFTTISEILPEV